MQFLVTHRTRYVYSVPVQLATHVVRLVPQQASLVVSQHALEIFPEPRVSRRERDGFGNEVVIAEFSGTTSEFMVTSQFSAVTSPPLPLDDTQWSALPWAYPPQGSATVFWRSDAVSPAVAAFAESLAADANYHPLHFLDHLSRTLFQRVDRGIRVEGAAQPAELTLQTMRGACRDVSVLFLECCRSMGLLGRFVSGYHAVADSPDGERHLHAWAEAYLPGAGWRGWDGMHGLRVWDGHIPLCRAPGQAGTMPIEGGFYFSGDVVDSTLDFSVRIETR